MTLQERKAEALKRLDIAYENGVNSLSWLDRWLFKGGLEEYRYNLYRQLISDYWDDLIKVYEGSDEQKQAD